MPPLWTDTARMDVTAWPLPPEAVTHPRTAGTFGRALRLWRQEGAPLMEAVRRATLLPAEVLEAAVPAMRRKGRVQAGADADLVVFDEAGVTDQATYAASTRPSSGIAHVLVGGTFVVRDGALVPDALPGRPSAPLPADPLGGPVHLGIAHHLGWAVAVTATADHEVVDRRRIELVGPDLPAAPIHHEGGAHAMHRRGEPPDDDALAALVADVRASVAREASAALDELAAALPGPIVSMSVRGWPLDFPTDIAGQRRVPYESRADSIMYCRCWRSSDTIGGGTCAPSTPRPSRRRRRARWARTPTRCCGARAPGWDRRGPRTTASPSGDGPGRRRR